MRSSSAVELIGLFYYALLPLHHLAQLGLKTANDLDAKSYSACDAARPIVGQPAPTALRPCEPRCSGLVEQRLVCVHRSMNDCRAGWPHFLSIRAGVSGL